MIRFAGAMAMAVPLIAADCIMAVGTALLLLGRSMLGLGRIMLRSDRLQRRQIVEALNRAVLRPLPLTGALAALLGVIVALAFGFALETASIEDSLLPVMRKALTCQAIPLLIGLLVLGEGGLGLTARLISMSLNGESDTLRSLGISPVEWVLPAALLEFLTLAAVQFLFALAVGHLATALVLQEQIGLPAERYAAALNSGAARANVWNGLARSEAGALFAWLIAACAGVSTTPAGIFAASASGESESRAIRRTFLITLLGLLLLAALFTWFGA